MVDTMGGVLFKIGLLILLFALKSIPSSMCGYTILQNSFADFTGIYIRLLLCHEQFNPNFLLSTSIKRLTSFCENAFVAR